MKGIAMACIGAVAAQKTDIPFAVYPGYTGPLQVTGTGNALSYNGEVYVWYDLQGLETSVCNSTLVPVPNACGIHIHVGKTCDDPSAVGGHYYDTTSLDQDPWSPITYTSADGTAKGKTGGINIGKEQNIAGRALVVHDSTGARIACGLLPSSFIVASPHVEFKPYPGYTGDLRVRGYSGAHLKGSAVMVWWFLSGVEADNCATAPVNVSNACGIHIHEGTTCDDATAVGGHYYDTDNIDADPWSPVTYSATKSGFARGQTKVDIGKGQNIHGRALVVHDSTGGRVACGLLPAKLFEALV